MEIMTIIQEFEKLQNELTPAANAAKSMTSEEVAAKTWMVVGAKMLKDRLVEVIGG